MKDIDALTLGSLRKSLERYLQAHNAIERGTAGKVAGAVTGMDRNHHMKKQDAVQLLTSVKEWNKYRRSNLAWMPDLSVVNLAGADLAGANLTGADLALADLTGAYLVGADLARANLTGANLRSADLRRADLAGADLAGTNFDKAKLRRSQVYVWVGEPDWQDT